MCTVIGLPSVLLESHTLAEIKISAITVLLQIAGIIGSRGCDLRNARVLQRGQHFRTCSTQRLRWLKNIR
jgi:hypothetical protein